MTTASDNTIATQVQQVQAILHHMTLMPPTPMSVPVELVLRLKDRNVITGVHDYISEKDAQEMDMRIKQVYNFYWQCVKNQLFTLLSDPKVAAQVTATMTTKESINQ